MSTIVCQNLVSSCFESPLTDTTPTPTPTPTLKLKVEAPPPEKLGTDFDHPANLQFRNWGSFQTVPNKESWDCTESDNSTQCPWAQKSSFLSLSAKSLELCTESLGSESGSDIITYGGPSIFASASPPLGPSSNSGEYSTPHYKMAETTNNWKREKYSPKNPNRSFPPPLTTMSGSSSLQVRRHAEGGRLIIEAVEEPFRNYYLQAERSDGRLRMCFLTAGATTFAAAGEEEEEEEEEVEWGGETAAAEEEEEEEEIEEARSEVGSELSDENEFDGEINENLEMESEKFQWLSRCKEEGGHGNKGLCTNWKPALWVAIS